MSQSAGADHAATAPKDPEARDQLQASHLRELRLQRNLKALVIGLGALILVGLAAIALKVMGGLGGARPAVSATAATTLSMPSGGEMALELPRGAKVVSVSVSGNRLAVTHESPTGTGIAVIDLDTGRRVDVKPVEALPRN